MHKVRNLAALAALTDTSVHSAANPNEMDVSTVNPDAALRLGKLQDMDSRVPQFSQHDIQQMRDFLSLPRNVRRQIAAAQKRRMKKGG